MTNFKKLLLAGTAVVAVSAFAPTAQAADLTLAADATWASSGNADSDPTTTITDASAGDNVSVTSNATITITNDGAANDGGGVNAFTLGNVTDTATANIAITSGAGADLMVTIGSANIAGNFTVTGDAADDATIAVNLTNASAIGGNLVLDNSAADAADTVTLTAGNTLAVTGTTAVTAGTAAGSAAALVANGAATFTGAVTFTGGGNATADATGTFNADATFTGGVTLDDATGQAVLTFDTATDGTSNTVAGNIDGAAAGEGDIIITESDATTNDSVTFTGNIGATNAVNTITLGTAGADGANAVFNGTVAANTISVGVADPDGDTTTADFNGDVTATNINLLGGDTAGETATATFAGNVTGAIDLDDGTAGDGTTTATFDGSTAQTIATALTTDDGEGTVVVSNTAGTTFSSTLGTGAAGLDAIQIATGGVATFTDNTFTNADAATDAGVDVDGTLNINAAGGAVTVLEDTGDIDIDGTVSITGANAVTFNAGSDVFIDGSSTFSTALTGGAETTITGAGDVGFGTSANTVVNLSNALNINSGDDVLFGDDVPAAGGDGFNTTINVIRTADFDPTAVDVIDQVGESNLDGDGVLTFTIGSTTAEFDTGDTITLVDGDTVPELNGVATTWGALITSGDVVLQDTAFLNLESNAAVTDVAAGDLGVTLTYNSAANVLTGSSYDNFADTVVSTLTSADTTAGGALETFRGAVQGATTANVQRLVESGAPNVDGSAQVGVVSTVTNTSLGVTGERMASLRSSDETGMAAGNMTHGLKAWGKVFGTSGEQDDRDGVSGYDVDSYGVTVGLDTQTLAEDWVWGLAFTYADTEADSSGLANTNVDVDTYQFTVYGDYKWDAATYVNTQLGYAMNSGDQTKTNVGGAGLVANADVDSDVFFARVEAGRDYDMDNGWTLTPIAMMNYQHINSDDYTETGTCGTLCLTNVDIDNINIFELGLGGEASYLHQNSDGSFLKPKLHAAYRYDLIGDEVETTGSFADPLATSTFTAAGFDAQQSTFNVGAGLEFFTTSNWELSVNYDYEIKEDYDGHNGYVRAAYKF